MLRFEQVQLEVEGLVKARGTMEGAVDLIYSTDGLDAEERAALWLLAWSLLPERHQDRAHRIAASRLGALVGRT